jgi:hypothetical protein
MKRKDVEFLALVIVAGVVIFIIDPAIANRLEQAAEKGRSMIVSIGQVTSVVGIVVGGIFYSIGASNLGRTVLIGGFVGAIATIGAPAIISFIRDTFS